MAPAFSFYLSGDVDVPLQVHVAELRGLLPEYRSPGIVAAAEAEADAVAAAAAALAGRGGGGTATAADPQALLRPPPSAAGTAALDAARRAPASALYVQARVVAPSAVVLSGAAATAGAGATAPPAPPPQYGSLLGLDSRTAFADAAPGGAAWREWLPLVVKVRDLPADARLEVLLWRVTCGGGGAEEDDGGGNEQQQQQQQGDPAAASAPRVVAAAGMRLFNKRGRLKTGLQRLQLVEGAAVARLASPAADATSPAASDTAPVVDRLPLAPDGKRPLRERGPAAQSEHLQKLHARGEVPAVAWLDGLARREAALTLAADGARRAARPALELAVVLPSFPHAVLHQQPPVGAVGAALAAGTASAAAAQAQEQARAAAAAAAASAAATAAAAAAAAAAGEDRQPPPTSVSSAATAAAIAAATNMAAASAAAASYGGAPPLLPPLLPSTAATSAGGAAAAANGDDDGATGLPPAPVPRALYDTEVGMDNPCEAKAAKLARSLQRHRRGAGGAAGSAAPGAASGAAASGGAPGNAAAANQALLLDSALRPNGDERRRIAAVLASPPDRPLSQDERELLWRFRVALSADPRALTRFLRSAVDWRDADDASQARLLMARWAPVSLADALELLSPAYRDEAVRAHAVAALARKPDAELLRYLLQLVQALRFEPGSGLGGGGGGTGGGAGASSSGGALAAAAAGADRSPLARLVVSRAARSAPLATLLHWCLFAEWEDPEFGPRASAVHGALVEALTTGGGGGGGGSTSGWRGDAGRPILGGEAVWEAIRRQTDMIAQLGYVVTQLKKSGLRAAKATEKLRTLLSPADGPCGELASAVLPSPLDPSEVLLEGLVPEECFCFKSAQLPVMLVFRASSPCPADWACGSGASAGAAGQQQPGHDDAASSGGPGPQTTPPPPPPPPRRRGLVKLIYKKGDDLRQDQFVLQMIALMDDLLKREGLDLRLSPYRVLPTGADEGLVEFVPSSPLSRVLQEHRTVHRWLLAQRKGANADPNAPYGLRRDVLDAFVRSCAGYCVATYILGVGDRHLDNLMLRPDGRLFHIDFGFILGADPKPFPPPMKLCREMIEAMGGAGGSEFLLFRTLCCEAYNCLRKSAPLLLSLFHLMAASGVAAVRRSPEGAALHVRQKLQLEFSDEQAVAWMQSLIDESSSALMPQVIEATHRFAQYWR
jgi:phosphatidylinositol 3-kinase